MRLSCYQCAGVHFEGWCPADRHAVNRVPGKPHIIRHRRHWESWSQRGMEVARTMAAKQYVTRLNSQ